MLRTKGKEKNLESSQRKNDTVPIIIKITANFSSETMEENKVASLN